MNASPYKPIEIFRIGDEQGGDSIFFESHLHARTAVSSANQFLVGGGRRVPPVMSFSDEGRLLAMWVQRGKGLGSSILVAALSSG